jgi:cyclopropane fatty-acyl-phospholipid synthase-like methyltransferase
MIRRILYELGYLFGRTPWDTGITPPELSLYLDETPPGRALDLGCGTGTNIISIAKRGWQVVGVDFSNRAIRKARLKAKAAGVSVELRHGDVNRLAGFQEPFDLVLDIGCFHSLSSTERTRYALNLGRLVRPGGTYLLYSWINPHNSSYSDWPSEGEIRATFGEQFDCKTIAHGTDRHHTAAWFTFHKES